MLDHSLTISRHSLCISFTLNDSLSKSGLIQTIKLVFEVLEVAECKYAIGTRCTEGRRRCHISIQRPRKPPNKDFRSVWNTFMRKVLVMTWVVDALGTRFAGGRRRYHIRVQ